MNKYFNTYNKRINRLNIILVLFGLFILSEYFILQFKTNSNIEKIIDSHGYKYKMLYGKRGKIVDRNNNELANSINKYTLWIDGQKISNEKSKYIFDYLSDIFNKNSEEYNNLFCNKKKYIVLEKNVSENQFNKMINEIDNLKNNGLRFDVTNSRFYKYKNFASQTIGFINKDGKGIGIEKTFNNTLSGDTLKVTLRKGAKGNYYNENIKNEEFINGYNVQLTLDIETQIIVQEELNKIVKSTNAKSGNAILMNPHNGEIIAIASAPDFDPNSYFNFDPESYRNRSITESYEPGSTFKIIPYALNIEQKKFSIEDSINCENGKFLLANNKILHDHEPHENLSIIDIMAHSSNIGFSKISDSFSKNDLYKLIKYFGFGTKTYIALNNESKGKIRDIDNWSKTSKSYISIGQELSVTNLQLSLAYSAVANGGIVNKPKIIKKIHKNNFGKEDHIKIEKNNEIRRIFNKKTSDLVMESLSKVVEIGTAKDLGLDEYKISGKTGTAQKYVNGNYSNYIATFASIFPNDFPEYVLIISIDEPKYGYHWSSQSAVPATKEIIKRMMISDNEFHARMIKKDFNKDSSNFEYISDQSNNIKKITNEIKNEGFPNLKGKTFKEALKIASKYNVKLKPGLNLSGKITYQSIKEGKKINADMICEVLIKTL